MKRGTVIIPESSLDADVHELERLKSRAHVMLKELEIRAGGSASVPVSWRHDPKKWLTKRTFPND